MSSYDDWRNARIAASQTGQTVETGAPVEATPATEPVIEQPAPEQTNQPDPTQPTY